MALSLCGRGVVVRLPFEGSAVLFQGCDASVVREWVPQCHGVVAGHAAQRRTVAGMASPGELAEQCRGVGALWRGFVFDLGACECQCIKSPCRGSRYGGGGLVMSSSETKTRSRGRSALDRDGTSLEGASSPRARRNPARGGAQPSSEAEPHPRGRPALERGGVLPVRHRHPQAKRSSVQGCLGRLSGGPWARGFILRVFLGSFAFVFLRR
jgi:hypothetical protein